MVSDLDEQQNTPLHLAVENRSYEVSKLCLEKGADVNKTTDNYSTPLHLSAVTGDIKIVQVLQLKSFVRNELPAPSHCLLSPKLVSCMRSRQAGIDIVMLSYFSCCCLTMRVLTPWISTNQRRFTERPPTTTAISSSSCSASQYFRLAKYLLSKSVLPSY